MVEPAMDATLSFPVDVLTWRAVVVLAAALVAWGDRIVVAVASLFRSRAGLEDLLADLAGEDGVRASLAARALERWSGGDLDARLAALLAHADLDVQARAERTLEMRDTPAAQAILSERRAFQRRRDAARLPDPDTLAPVEPVRLRQKVEHWMPQVEAGAAVIDGPEATQVAAAMGHALVARGHRVLFQPARHLVGELAHAHAGGWLGAACSRLDSFEVLIVDGVDPAAMPKESMALLAELAAHRAGRGATVFTSPLARAAWRLPEVSGTLALPAA